MAFFDEKSMLTVDVIVDKRTREFLTEGSGWLFRKGTSAKDMALRLASPVNDVLAADRVKEEQVKPDDNPVRKRKARNSDSG